MVLKVDERFFFEGGLLWLDFVNTELRSAGQRTDRLEEPGDLLRWLELAGVLGGDEAGAARERWEGAGEGEELLAWAKRLRGALREAARAMAQGELPGEAAIEEVNRVLAARPGYTELVRQGDGFTTRVRPVGSGSSELLAAIAESFVELLTEGDPNLVKQCNGPRCILYFYDTTKNHSRRWCSMKSCGNRAKVAAHRARRRG